MFGFGKTASFGFEPNSFVMKVYRDEDRLLKGANDISFFEEELGDKISKLLAIVSSNIIDPIEDYDYTFVNKVFKDLSTRYLGQYRFIVGAGVSLDYGIKDWDKLTKVYNQEAQDYLNVELNKILKTSYNTTYGSFQIVKDLNCEKYYQILESEILKGKESKLIGYSTLSGIADVVSNQFIKSGDVN